MSISCKLVRMMGTHPLAGHYASKRAFAQALFQTGPGPTSRSATASGTYVDPRRSGGG
jgi:hypothetical protein